MLSKERQDELVKKIEDQRVLKKKMEDVQAEYFDFINEHKLVDFGSEEQLEKLMPQIVANWSKDQLEEAAGKVVARVKVEKK